jgi:hypothetical protein
MATSLVSLSVASHTESFVATGVLTGEGFFSSMRVHVNSKRAGSGKGSVAARTRIATLALSIRVRRLLWKWMTVVLWWPLLRHLRINRRHLLTMVWRRKVRWKRPLMVQRWRWWIVGMISRVRVSALRWPAMILSERFYRRCLR